LVLGGVADAVAALVHDHLVSGTGADPRGRLYPLIPSAHGPEEADMKVRTADAEKRSGIHWLIAGAITLVAMLGMWWLVADTNSEGSHDAELLPLFALIPLTIGAYHLARSHSRRARRA
jgi:hypothetical protein